MRLFIAVNLPNEIVRECQRVQALNIHANASKLRTFHITLKFLGETTPTTAEKVSDALKEIQVTPFTVTLNALGVFPSPSYPRVLWIGVQPLEPFIELQRAVDSSLKHFYPRDKRFHPHITLARIKTLTSKKAFQNFLTKTKIKPISFEVKSFSLIESKLSPKGAQYTEKAAYS